MNWNQLLSATRWGNENRVISSQDDARSQFQRDYDRLIFSSPFRRLQNKTQVFPLPGSVFVHNRLTHSLEVASVGRSMGRIFYNELKKADDDLDIKNPLMSEIGNIVAAAALAHDLGNPPFGHSGETAIARYFTHGEGKRYKSELTTGQWLDFARFEGNANALRMLTHYFPGKGNGAFALTYSTLAAIVKYPCASSAGNNKGHIHTKKYGFFQSEEQTFEKLATALQLARVQENPLIYKRHPLVYLVEAADDICYSIIDLEDACRLKILSYEIVKQLLLTICSETTISERLESEVQDTDAKVGLLRARAINTLIRACSKIFIEQEQVILNGNFNKSLTDSFEEPLLTAWKKIEEISIQEIYNHTAVAQIEIAGYQVLGGLLEEFVPAVVQNNSHYHQKLIKLIPLQFISSATDSYSKIQGVVDFISGMTDLYAVELYRKLKGISFSSIG